MKQKCLLFDVLLIYLKFILKLEIDFALIGDIFLMLKLNILKCKNDYFEVLFFAIGDNFGQLN